MHAFDAKVREGHIVIDEVLDFPEGTRLHIVVVDASDDSLSDDERRVRDEALVRSWQSVEQGRTRPVDALLARLRARE